MKKSAGGVSPKGVLYQTIDRESTSERVDAYLAQIAAEKAKAEQEAKWRESESKGNKDASE